MFVHPSPQSPAASVSNVTLSPEEQDVLLSLLDNEHLTPEQAEEALRMHLEHRTPLRDILGAMGYVTQKTFAAELAEAAETGFVGELLDSQFFDYDPEFARRFQPAELMRFLFCPLRHLEADNTVVALTATPLDATIIRAVRNVVPNADVLPLVATEIHVTRLVNDIFQEQLLDHAVNHLREQRPAESASRVFTRAQLAVFGGLAALLLVAILIDQRTTFGLLIAAISILYVVSIFFKLALSLGAPANARRGVSEQAITRLDDADLPIYSILVPVYKEPEVVPRLLKALARMDYPREKLDVLLLMEEDDVETIRSAKAARPPSFFRFIIVPECLPRTKPKACNYGLHFCRGEYVTIYDAEDIPEPDQLKKAVAAFRQGDERLLCVQAALNYFNSDENYLTRMFTLEYTYWFDDLLPGLDRFQLPIPLGGTSNHFRLETLRQLGAWDPFNVTEDADLGIRATANGYRVGVIRSTTYEEANKAFKNWIRQRSRWIKGYMQTWLVHNRRPLALLKRIGLKNWLAYNGFIGGTVAIFLINPLMWLLFLVWVVFQPGWMGEWFQGWVWTLAIFSLIVGNAIAILLNVIGILRRRKWRLVPFALTNPLYWTMHSIAAYMGLWQLIRKPFYWEKTQHGLTTVDTDALLGETKSG